MTDLTTVAAVKAFGNITTSADDSLLAALVGRASDIIRGYCARDITQGAYVETIDGGGSSAWMATQWPVTAVSSVTVNGNAIPASTGPTTGGYAFSPDKVVLRGYRFDRGALNVTIAYTAGMAIVPDEIEHVAILTALDAYRGRERDGAIRSESEPGVYSASYAPMSINDAGKQILDHSPFVRRF
jgi:hypothetical protein